MNPANAEQKNHRDITPGRDADERSRRRTDAPERGLYKNAEEKIRRIVAPGRILFQKDDVPRTDVPKTDKNKGTGIRE